MSRRTNKEESRFITALWRLFAASHILLLFSYLEGAIRRRRQHSGDSKNDLQVVATPLDPLAEPVSGDDADDVRWLAVKQMPELHGESTPLLQCATARNCLFKA